MSADQPVSDVAEIPPDLKAAAARADDQIVIVMGAGCSIESPTDLPLAGALSERIHKTLVDNGVLAAGACPEPWDLSAVAQATLAATGSQRALVDEFPPDEFRGAQPNRGHLILAALLREGVVGDVLSLNFDLSVSSALAHVGGAGDVRIIKGPEEHDRQGPRNLIYLHRNIESPPDDLILRPEQLEQEWAGQWEEVVARRVLSGPMTVFVGLGSPAAVLTTTATWIVNSVQTDATIYVVGPGEPEASAFFAALGVSADRYLRLGWCEFMHALGDRVLRDQMAKLEAGCTSLMQANPGWPTESVVSVCGRLGQLGLLGAGEIRARWFIDQRNYRPHPPDAVNMDLLADLVIGLALLERLRSREARLDNEGLANFDGPEGPTSIALVSGRGSRDWVRIEGDIARLQRDLNRRGRSVQAVLATGVTGNRESVVVPDNIAGEPDPTSVAGAATVDIVTPADLRAAPDIARRLVA
jgi:hypothetical protein